MRRRHAGEEDPSLLGVHVEPHPSKHAFHGHTIRILCGQFQNLPRFILERSQPVKLIKPYYIVDNNSN